MLKVVRSWSAGKLFVSWIGYWILLIAVGLGRAIPAIWRATHAEQGKGSLSLSFGDGGFTLSVFEKGATIYTGTIHLLPLALLVAGPPLALWVLWIASRSRRDAPEPMGGP